MLFRSKAGVDIGLGGEMGEVEEGGERWMGLSVVVFLGFLRMGIV